MDETKRRPHGDGGLSPEAQAWLAAEPRDDDAPIDFSTIVADRIDTLGRWHQASHRAIARHDVTVEPLTIDGVDCLRVTSPQAGTDGGTLVYIFGGAFIYGDPFSELPITAALAAYAGIEVICPSYRLAPEHPVPAASDDCLTVWRSVSSSRDRVAVGGESAGGNLALLTAQRARDEGANMPAALALLSPAADLRTDPSLVDASPDDPTLSKTRMFDVARVYPGDLPLDDPTVSPLFGAMTGLPPTLITTGTRDLLLPGCLRAARRMRRAGVDVDCRVWDGLWHVFEFYDAYPEADESLREIADFLRRELAWDAS